LVARKRSNQTTQKEIVTKRASITHAQSTNFGKWQPNLAEKEQEFEGLHAEIERGESLFDTLSVWKLTPSCNCRSF